jgi:GR25 family glycosyltransferase involved in LPS biosynthesis
MRLFDGFDKVYLINLDRRPDRLDNFQKQVEKYNLGEYERISAVDGNKLNLNNYKSILKPGEIGVILTNFLIIKSAQEKNFKKILIIEDDCEFTEEINNWEEYLNSVPKDWDMIYFGGNHNTHVGVNEPIKINQKIVKLHSTFSAHFIIINNTVFEHIKILKKNLSEPLDVSYSKFQKIFNCYSTSLPLAKQKPGFSDIQNQNLDYNWLIN